MYGDHIPHEGREAAPISRGYPPIDLTSLNETTPPPPGPGQGPGSGTGPGTEPGSVLGSEPLVVRMDASTTRLAPRATTMQVEVNFRFAKNIAATTGRPHSVIFWDACTDPRDPRWWVRTYYPNGAWGEDTLDGHESGSLASAPAPIFAAARRT